MKDNKGKMVTLECEEASFEAAGTMKKGKTKEFQFLSFYKVQIYMCLDKRKRKTQEPAITLCFPNQEANASMPRGRRDL